MARVLFVVPVGQDMGGIITSTEQYVAGIRDAGHDVFPICAVFTKRDEERGPMPRGKFADDYQRGPGTGWLLHPTAGWRNEDRVSLACPEGLKRFAAYVKGVDIVIWASVYGFRNDATEGNVNWMRAIKAASNVGQLFMIHDDHMEERYPWGLALARYATAFVGVQPCSYDSLRSVATARAMVYTPLAPLPKSIRSMADRRSFLSIQVWKGWKNGDKLVAAAPLMPKGQVFFGGDGIQLRYMRSPDKCPPRFAGLWDAAMKKQKYLGVLSEEQRDSWLAGGKFLVDLSVRQNSGQMNRIAQEAMAQGCVVIANPDFITGIGATHKAVFEPDVHYLPISTPHYDPKSLAAVLKEYDNINEKRYGAIQRNARKALTVFNRAKLGQDLVDIGLGKPGGLLYTHPPTLQVSKEADAAFKAIFGGKA